MGKTRKRTKRPSVPTGRADLVEQLIEIYQLAKSAEDYKTMLRIVQTQSRLLEDKPAKASRPENQTHTPFPGLKLVEKQNT